MNTLTTWAAAAAVIALVGCSKGKSDSNTKSEEPTTAAAAPTAGEGRDRPQLPGTDEPATDEDDLGEGEGDDEGAAPSPEDEAAREQRRKEFAEMRAQYDKDGDGRLNREERREMRLAGVEKAFTALDRDGDGSVSRAEAEAGDERMARMMARRFEQFDTDGNGTVSNEELKGAMDKMRSFGRRFGDRERGGPGMFGRRGPRGMQRVENNAPAQQPATP